jgi:hypothetical protein
VSIKQVFVAVTNTVVNEGKSLLNPKGKKDAHTSLKSWSRGKFFDVSGGRPSDIKYLANILLFLFRTSACSSGVSIFPYLVSLP